MRKNIIIILVIALVAIGAWYFFSGGNVANAPGEKEEEVAEIMTQETQEQVYKDLSLEESLRFFQENKDDESFVVLDVSSAYEKGRIPGAVNFYIGDGSLDDAIAEQKLDIEKTYLVYCHVQSASIAGAEKLVEAGFSPVYRIDGVYSDWVAAGYPVEVSLSALEGFEGEGTAQRSFVDGNFSHSVSALIEDPKEGKFFEGWLVKGPNDFFSTGRMEKEDGIYVLRYDSSENKYDYPRVVITEETESLGLDGNPETHVLEGTF